MDSTARAPVLSLTVLDGNSLRSGRVETDAQVLVVVRDAGTNPTHPNVVSVPTQRLPASLYDDIVASADVAGDDVAGNVRFFRGGLVDTSSDSGHHPVVYAVEALLARKLGLAEPLERDQLRLRAALRARVDGVAVYETGGEPEYEHISMLNVLVELADGRALVPIRTGSYSLIAWTEVAQFVAGVRSRDAGTISPALDAIELCVHGVCLAAAEAVLSHLLGHAPLAMPAAESRVTGPGR